MWVNKTTLVYFPNDSLVFNTIGKNWEATLLSFSQPIAVKISFTNKGLILSPKNNFGITEGAAQLILSNGSQAFYYEFTINNSSVGSITEKDYRSPKTVNPDSSLVQHRMQHSIDEWRNIVHLPGQLNPFYENILQLNPIAGSYRAQAKNALSAFYVQPGSTTSFEVTSNYLKDENVFSVTAGPLKDTYDNTVANGTMVVFIYGDGEKTYQMEAALLNGFARIKIPVEKNRKYYLTAKVNETASKQIQLQP